MKLRLLLLFPCVAAVFLTSALGQTQTTNGKITEVSLKRWTRQSAPHEPVDVVVLRSDGTATYDTKKEWAGLGPGRYKGTFHLVEFWRLTEFLQSQKFLDMNDTQKTAVRHTTMHTTTVVQNGKSKVVVNYNNRLTPLGLWSVEKAIHGITFDIRWEKADVKTD